jgi:hypothetical protein
MLTCGFSARPAAERHTWFWGFALVAYNQERESWGGTHYVDYIPTAYALTQFSYHPAFIF